MQTATTERSASAEDADGRVDRPASADDLAAFRERCRRFLVEHATGNPEPGPADPRGDAAMQRAREFERARYDAGLAGITVPRELGGQGLSADHERIWTEEAARHPYMTEPLAVSLGNCLAFLLRCGTPEQQHRWVRPLLRADAVACQLFSEPDAGSDLANVRTRAERDPSTGGWRMSGQKVWTTYAHLADVGVALARTEELLPGGRRHDGLSMFLVDLRAPGVETRAIRQIDGAQLFDEVFLDRVPVGLDALVPPEGGGWKLAVEMMHAQRLARGTTGTGGIRHIQADAAATLARASGRLHDPLVRDRIARVAVDEMIRSLNSMRVRSQLAAGQPPGPAGSLSKLEYAQMAPRAADLIASLTGPGAVAWESPDAGDVSDRAADDLTDREHAERVDAVAHEIVHTRQYAIAGGTSEVQRNIIAERVLGLPK